VRLERVSYGTCLDWLCSEKTRREQRTLDGLRSDKTLEIQNADKAILNGEVALQRLRNMLSEVANLRQSLNEVRTEIEANEARNKARPTSQGREGS
jgi:hypothetical protein